MTWVVLCHSYSFAPGSSTQNTKWSSDVRLSSVHLATDKHNHNIDAFMFRYNWETLLPMALRLSQMATTMLIHFSS